MVIALNRPHVLNSLSLEMIGMIRASLERAESDTQCGCVLLCGAGDRAFCAGGDIKTLAQWAGKGDFDSADRFFGEEYALDLYIHGFPKPVLVIADGITMGGGLGLAAGADLVVATERTRMAMPETGIGFFPDVGASRWLFDKCPKGYAEFLGLTGHELKGADTVHGGLATHLLPSKSLKSFLAQLRELPISVSKKQGEGLSTIRSILDAFCERPMPSMAKRDRWIGNHFANKISLHGIIHALKASAPRDQFAREILETLMGHSPTALMLTFTLLRRNATRPLKEAFQVEQKAAAFMIRHPDYLEGVGAQVLRKDHRPQWRPTKIEDVVDLEPFSP
jgi:enoyl-CoA hydratase/carnithine racemase